MNINKVEIKHFRLLEDVSLSLEKQTTVIVGRNNSGKTSLTELFRRLLSDMAPTFRLEDFSLLVHEQFWDAYVLKFKGGNEEEIRKTLPFIEVKLTVRYDKAATTLGPLSEFVIDLNLDCTEAVVLIRYQLKDGEIDALFEGLLEPDDKNRADFFRVIRERIPKNYVATVLAIDPNDPMNQRIMDWPKLRRMLQSGFINAQRGLDDITHKDRDVLGKILEGLLNTAMSDTADSKDRDIAQKLEAAVDNIQKDIDAGFNKQLKDLLPSFSLFGYPGLSDPGILTETILDVQRLLTNHTRVHYEGINGINLPEAYNGLGVRNLIFILLKLLEFYKSFIAMPAVPAIHLVFIEEPEVHLHPQMQEVFIRKLGEIADSFVKNATDKLPWPVQFVVTTHSTHMANEAPFQNLRYFHASSVKDKCDILATQIKDLRQGLDGTSQPDQDFLHKYMTLTRCDLLFADKAVLIEGITERLLLPRMIAKVEKAQSNGSKLSSQYVSIVEIGGAHAHRFFKLLEFLELRTLIITDLDAGKKNDTKKITACKVSESTHTSNGCIKDWFGKADVSPADLIKKTNEEKISGFRRIAYQVPEAEDSPCGRSFEQTFILANPNQFGLESIPMSGREDMAWAEADKIPNKSDFALEYAIEKDGWAVPRYIAEGLQWLAEGERCPAATSAPSKDISIAAPAILKT
jgi:predicted ATP-dependent endonuclease of OLD family